MSATTHEAAYFAGLIDGEGSLGLTIHKGKYFYPRVLVCNINRLVLERGKFLFGGDIRLRPLGKMGKRPCYEWRLNGKSVKKLLIAIFPFSVIKRGQVDALLNKPACLETKQFIQGLNNA